MSGVIGQEFWFFFWLCMYLASRGRRYSFIFISLCRYWDTLLGIMWPRFETILHLNIHSVRDVDPQKFGHIDNRPHYVSVTVSQIFYLLYSGQNWCISCFSKPFDSVTNLVNIYCDLSYLDIRSNKIVLTSFICRTEILFCELSQLKWLNIWYQEMFLSTFLLHYSVMNSVESCSV
jgi:hypothetical protein